MNEPREVLEYSKGEPKPLPIIHHAKISCTSYDERRVHYNTTTHMPWVTCESCITTFVDHGCGECAVCGEFTDPVTDNQGIGEFVTPSGLHVQAHADCGLNEKDWVLA